MLVAGDLYDSAAPSAAAQRLVVRTLMALARTEAQVVVIAGNHDHAATFDAYRPFAGAAGVTLVGSVRTAETGGLVEFTSRGGERATVAVLPFLSQRYAVRAAELVAQSPAENTSTYDQHVRSLVRALTAGFRTDAVNLVMAHLTVLGGTFGGGERAAQSIFEYSVPAAVFPPDAHYVALGHLHRRQALAAPGAGALLRCPAGRRLRGTGQQQRRAADRGHAHHARPGHGHPDRGRAAAADGARHGRRAGRHGRRPRGRPAARRRARARAGRATRGGHGAAAERAGGADRPGVRRIRHRLPAEHRGHGPQPRRAVPRVPGHAGGRRPAGRGALRAAARPDRRHLARSGENA